MGTPEPTPCSPPLALKRLRGWDDVGAEIEEIRQEDEAERAAGFISVLKLFGMRSLRWQVISIIVLMGGQQLSGVNAVWGRWGRGSGWAVSPRGWRCRRRCPEGPTSLWGTFQIYYYADQIYLSAGVNDHDVQYVTAGTGAVNVLMTVCAVSLRQPPRTEGILRRGGGGSHLQPLAFVG